MNKKNRKKSFSSPKNAMTGGLRLFAGALFGVGVGILSLLAMLVMFASLCLSLKQPLGVISPLALTSIYLSAFLCGFCALRYNQGNAILLCGATSGVAFYVVLRIIFLLFSYFSGDSAAAPFALALRLAIIPIAFVGALCASKKSVRRRKKKF